MAIVVRIITLLGASSFSLFLTRVLVWLESTLLLFSNFLTASTSPSYGVGHSEAAHLVTGSPCFYTTFRLPEVAKNISPLMCAKVRVM